MSRMIMVNGRVENALGKLFEMEGGTSTLVILAGGFFYPEEVTKLLENGTDFGILTNDRKKDLIDRTVLEAQAWVETIAHLEEIGSEVFVIHKNFPIYYKDDMGFKRHIDFEKGLLTAMGRRVAGHRFLPRNIHYIRDIDVFHSSETTIAFWPNESSYQDDFLHLRCKSRVLLVSDGLVNSGMVKWNVPTVVVAAGIDKWKSVATFYRWMDGSLIDLRNL